MNQPICKIHWKYSTDQEEFDPELWNKWEKDRISILSDSVHPVRLKSSVLARMSFEKLKTLYQDVYNPSYSHTGTIGLCSVTERPNEFSGIDIEKCGREVPEKSHHLFMNDQDDEIDPLKLWCIKEAAFKALSNSFDRTEPKVLKEITISNDSSFFYKDQSGMFTLEEVKIGNDKYFISTSLVRNEEELSPLPL